MLVENSVSTLALPQINKGVDKVVPTLNLLSSGTKMALTPKVSPPKKITVSPPEKVYSVKVSPKSQSPRLNRRNKKASLDTGANSLLAAAVSKKSCVSPVRTTNRIGSANEANRRSDVIASEEEIIRANLKALRESSNSANANGRKFDVKVVTRTAIKSMRQNRRSLESLLQEKGGNSASEGTNLSVYTKMRGSGSGIPRPHSHSATSSLKTSLTHSLRKSKSTSDGDGDGDDNNSDRGSSVGESGSGCEGEDPRTPKRSSSSSSRSGGTSTSTDFQAQCRARAAKKHKELMARANEEHAALRNEETRLQQSLRLRKEEVTIREKAKRRNRAEVYAINAYLKELEQARFNAFLFAQKAQEAEQAARDGAIEAGGNDDDEGGMSEDGAGEHVGRRDIRDDVSWCSADSSVMPTPRYRNERERNYNEENRVKLESDSETSQCSSRSSASGHPSSPQRLGAKLKRRDVGVRESVGGGV